jgi:antitoxin VapB
VKQVAKLFKNGKSQAVCLPVAFRFDTKEVFIGRAEETGDVILSRKPADWEDFLSAIQEADVPAGFLSKAEREQGSQDCNPFAGWRE